MPGRYSIQITRFKRGAVLSLIGLLTACSHLTPSDIDTANSGDPVLVCTPASNHAWLGKWLAVHTKKGVVGELRTLFSLQADGSMALTEQIKRPRQPSQGISETGCWHQEGSSLVLQTAFSNDEAVDRSDPIYTNRYTQVSLKGDLLRLTTPQGQKLTARRMPAGYRLPF